MAHFNRKTHIIAAMGLVTIAMGSVPSTASADGGSQRDHAGHGGRVVFGSQLPDHADSNRRDRGHSESYGGHRSWRSRLDRNFERLGKKRSSVRRAARAFSKLASERPRSASPKVGYAIANVLLDDYHDAESGFRRAVRMEVGALDRVPLSRTARDRVHYRAIELEDRAAHGQAGSGRWFLIASMYLTAGDEHRARTAIRRAYRDGGSSRAVERLADYLGVDRRKKRDRHRKRRERGRGARH